MSWDTTFFKEEIKRLRLKRLFNKICKAITDVLPILNEEDVYRIVLTSRSVPYHKILIDADSEGKFLFLERTANPMLKFLVALEGGKKITDKILDQLDKYGVYYELDYYCGWHFYRMTNKIVR
jgi:hypothetical protein